MNEVEVKAFLEGRKHDLVDFAKSANQLYGRGVITYVPRLIDPDYQAPAIAPPSSGYTSQHDVVGPHYDERTRNLVNQYDPETECIVWIFEDPASPHVIPFAPDQ